MFPPSFTLFIIFLILIIAIFNCLSTKSFVVLREEETINNNTNNEVFKSKELNDKQKKFMLKCPKTSKNISSIEWSHNNQNLFTVNFTKDGTPQIFKNNSKWSIKARAWHSIDKDISMILTAKNGRLKVEIEMETLKNLKKEQRRQWMILRLNKINIKEDRGIWKCQIFVNDEKNWGKWKLEGESRKQIEDDSSRRPIIKEFIRRGRQTTNQNKLDDEESWYLLMKQSFEEEEKSDDSRTFGFSKSDGNYAIFERLSSSSIGSSKKFPSLSSSLFNSHKIEYIRNTKKISESFENDKKNTLKWRRQSRTAAAKNCVVYLKKEEKQILLFLFILILSIIYF